MDIRHYEVGRLIGESPVIRTYLGKDKQQNGKDVIIKVAKTVEYNEILARDARMFLEYDAFLKAGALLPETYGEQFKEAHYDWLAAKLEASFVEPSQGDRMINVISFPDVRADELVPLAKVADELAVDSQTSFWIAGRVLKFYAAYELIAEMSNLEPESGKAPPTEYPVFSRGNFLLAPREHRLICCNFDGKVRVEDLFDFAVEQILERALELCGESSEDFEKYDGWWDSFLSKVLWDDNLSFERVHEAFYEAVHQYYGHDFHPFTYRKKDSLTWKVLEGGEKNGTQNLFT